MISIESACTLDSLIFILLLTPVVFIRSEIYTYVPHFCVVCCDKNIGCLVLHGIKASFGLAYASVNSSSAHPPPPPADPRELGFFENKLANAPPPGQKSCSNAPG